jgi:hypothetical protein
MNDLEEKRLEEEYGREIMDEFEKSDAYRLMDFWKTGLIHRTSISGFYGVQGAGLIKANSGAFKYTYPKSSFGYGSANGYVCLFDFESADPEQYLPIWMTWSDFFTDQQPATILLRLSRGYLCEKLIPNSAPSSNCADKKTFHVPFVEVWYPEPIPVSAIESYLLVVRDFSTNPIGVRFEEFAAADKEKLVEAISFIESRSPADFDPIEQFLRNNPEVFELFERGGGSVIE